MTAPTPPSALVDPSLPTPEEAAALVTGPKTAGHCPSCTCPPDLTDAEVDAWTEAERLGTDEGHEHCPDCGCDPNDHEMHAEECRRIGQRADIQCGPPWKPWPAANDGSHAHG